MSRALTQPGNFGGAGFRPVMARAAEGNKVAGGVRRGNAPRDNVVNVQLLPLARQRALRSSALTARIPVTFADCLGGFLPCNPALVMLGRAALPPGAVGARSAHKVGQNIAVVRAKAPRLAIKAAKLFTARGTFCDSGFLAAPARSVIAGHIAKPARFGVIGVCLKSLAATFTVFRNAGLRLALAASPALVPRGTSIGTGASAGAILAAGASGKMDAAFCAVMVNGLHKKNIRRTRFNNKDFNIACKRVDEATRQPDLFVEPIKKPEQQGMDL